MSQRAYVFTATDGDSRSKTARLQIRGKHALTHPAFIIKRVQAEHVDATINGQQVPPTNLRHAIADQAGVNSLLLYLEQRLPAGSVVELTME